MVPLTAAESSPSWLVRARVLREQACGEAAAVGPEPCEPEEATTLTALVELLAATRQPDEAAHLLGLGCEDPGPTRSGRYGREWGERAVLRVLECWAGEVCARLWEAGSVWGAVEAQASRRAYAQARLLGAMGVDEGWISPHRELEWAAGVSRQAAGWLPRLQVLASERRWAWLETSQYSVSGVSGAALRGEVSAHSWSRLSIVAAPVAALGALVVAGTERLEAEGLTGMSWEEAVTGSRRVGELALGLPRSAGGRMIPLTERIELAELVLAP